MSKQVKSPATTKDAKNDAKVSRRSRIGALSVLNITSGLHAQSPPAKASPAASQKQQPVTSPKQPAAAAKKPSKQVEEEEEEEEEEVEEVEDEGEVARTSHCLQIPSLL